MLNGIAVTNSSELTECRAGTHASRGVPAVRRPPEISSTARSPLPRTYSARSPRPRIAAMVSSGWLPQVRSPHETISSTSAASISASTAVRAATFACTSDTTATRFTGP